MRKQIQKGYFCVFGGLGPSPPRNGAVYKSVSAGCQWDADLVLAGGVGWIWLLGVELWEVGLWLKSKTRKGPTQNAIENIVEIV